MNSPAVRSLRRQVEIVATLSITHLGPRTRGKLASGDLSVPARCWRDGGLLRVGAPPEPSVPKASAEPTASHWPTEPDLAAVFEAARGAGAAWLRFEPDGELIDGLPVLSGAAG